ncbi:PREDICTED: putative nuclease HARBI1 isoform X2 [Priapulus caudatus]|uniref:Nuclease HARBI1 isoform X2 n=1 Tax=Priapulus caudatus TaxID=37621 RepID=A0ABM1ETF4_PRICU|nr:PREDICTED: putative nuclease HARBI1 isoform X2 [Priapulus caudatus]
MCKANFHSIVGFPGVIACVDCTHIRMQGPRKAVEKDYVNRKGYHSINTQGIVNADGLFLNLVARWPGSVHDSFIFRTSNLGRALEDDPRSGGIEGGLLLGDSGYALSRFLVTPYMQHQPRKDKKGSMMLTLLQEVL